MLFYHVIIKEVLYYYVMMTIIGKNIYIIHNITNNLYDRIIVIFVFR